MTMTRDEWERGRERRRSLQYAEWEAFKAWWDGYKAALPVLAQAMIPNTIPSGMEFATHTEQVYRERRRKTEEAIAKIWEGFTEIDWP